MTEVGALVIYAADPARTTAFYRALGIALEREDHGQGAVHDAVELAGIHLAVYRAEAPGHAPRRRESGSTFLGFYVESLDKVLAEVAEQGAPLLGGHEEMPWGCRVVVEDPDGRPVEINQRGHCATVE